MKSNDMFIEDLEELESLLSRAYWIEDDFEQMAYWEGYTSLHEKYRDIIFRLSHDSEKHKIMLNKVISNIKGIDLDAIKKKIVERTGPRSGRRRMDEEVLADLIRNDRLALDLYSKIHKHTSKDLIKELWKGEDIKEFYETFEHLMTEEKKHIDILRPHVGKLERIR